MVGLCSSARKQRVVIMLWVYWCKGGNSTVVNKVLFWLHLEMILYLDANAPTVFYFECEKGQYKLWFSVLCLFYILACLYLFSFLRVSPKTLLTFCTNGVLLRTLMGGIGPLATVTHIIVVCCLNFLLA
jgi:hypothetical protein